MNTESFFPREPELEHILLSEADSFTEATKMAKKKESQKAAVDENFNFIVRIANTDIDGQKKTVVGLQSITGVGKRVAQIVAKKADVDPHVKMGSLPDEKVKEKRPRYHPEGRHQQDEDDPLLPRCQARGTPQGKGTENTLQRQARSDPRSPEEVLR